MAQLLDEITASELVEWMAFGRLEPFGGTVEDYRAGLAASIMYNANKGKDVEPMMPLDFYDHHEKSKRPEPKKLSPEETSKAIAALLGKADYK